MIGGIEVKVCGLTRASDARDAAALGVDFLGFNFFPESPRYIDVERYRSIKRDLPDTPKMAVTVSPDDELLETLAGLDFDYFQIHYPSELTPVDRLREWSERVSPQKLWLAPRIAPGEAFDESVIGLADGFLCDTYHKDAFGGTGQTGDWEAIARRIERFPDTNWILAGGLGPENALEALSRTGAKRIDLNSGVEKSPGIKDQSKIRQVKLALENR